METKQYNSIRDKMQQISEKLKHVSATLESMSNGYVLARDVKMQDMIETMNEVADVNILLRCRKVQYVRARSILAFYAQQQGHTTMEIGDALGMNHSTVSHMTMQARTALAGPFNMYHDYYYLYVRFTQCLIDKYTT